MATVKTVTTLGAKTTYSLEDVLQAAGVWLRDKPTEFELFQRFHRASRTKSRSYVLPLEQILQLEGQNVRAQLFQEYGVPLGCEVVSAALSQANLCPEDIGTVVFTSCTSPVIPSIDAEILQRLGLSPSVKRVPMYQQGCAGGVVGLALADRLASSGDNVLLLSIELCSLLFRLKESSSVHILGSALFADGAAASVLTPESGSLRILATQSHLISETGHLMGYEIREDGAHLRLDRELPSALQSALPKIVGAFFETHGWKVDDFPWWVIHPGGVKILEGIASLLKLKESQYSWAYDVLSETGNMSSATVQFVLSKCLASGVVRAGEKVLMIGIGPGLTVELIAFEYLSE